MDVFLRCDLPKGYTDMVEGMKNWALSPEGQRILNHEHLNKDKDVTNQVSFDLNDGALLPLIKCVCGQEYDPWDHLLNDNRKQTNKCSNCERELYFTVEIKVYEKIGD